MTRKAIFAGALCACMLCPTVYAFNSDVNAPASDSGYYYDVRADVTVDLNKPQLLSTTDPVETALERTSSEASVTESSSTITPTAESPTADGQSADAPLLEEIVDVSGPVEIPIIEVPYWTGERATISKTETDGVIELKTEIGSDLSLKVNESTIIIDNQQAIPVNSSDLKVGDEVYVYIVSETNSSPTATAIVTNLGEGSIVQLHMAESVTEDGDTTSVLCDHGDIIVRAMTETEFKPYRTREIVTAKDLKANTPFLAWYDIVAESYPGQATANRIVILPSDVAVETGTEATETSNTEIKAIKIGENEIEAMQVGDRIHVPARAVGEALGLAVDWYKDNGVAFVYIYGDSGSVAMAIGEDKYTFLPTSLEAESASQTFGTTPYYAPYKDAETATWIDAEAFKMMGFTLTPSGNILNIG